MSPLAVALIVGAVVLAGIVTTCSVCLGWDTLQNPVQDLQNRLMTVSPYLAITGVFFLLRRLTNDLTVEISAAIGFQITDLIYQLEGLFVAHVQNATPDALVPVFSAFYMFGFAYLLVTPIVLYLLTPALRELKELLVAYVLNYLAGSIFYTLFIAYGPRIHVASHVDGLLYDWFPESQELTAAMSSKTDVFPSLHTSLAIIVLLFAWQTRPIQPRWFPVAAVVSTGVVLSTMILGIHWAIDVVAGILLAVACWALARYLVRTVEDEPSNQPTSDDRHTDTA